MAQEGQLQQADFFDNIGGFNLSDTPFRVKPTQATGGNNYDYVATGGLQKTFGHPKVNTSANSILKSLGLALHNTSTGTKVVIRATDSKVQTVLLDTAAFTALSEDTAVANQTFFTTGSTQPVVFSQFNTSTANTLWMAGGGATAMYGVNGSGSYQVTKNGVSAPTGSITATRVGASGGSFASTGTYFYSVVYRKTSTQSNSNAALDVSATVSATTDKVTINVSGLSNLDTTKFDQIWIYRSAVGGVSAFTTGDLIAKISSSTTSYDDLGSFLSTSVNVPRAGYLGLDNSELPSGTYKTIASWKRHLVTASGSTVYISDINKPESWPTANYIVVPSGGDITGLTTIGFNTPNASTPEEFLVVFKERELWLITGTTTPTLLSTTGDLALKFIDSIGCATQALIVPVGGFIAWVDYRGIFIWNGDTKPIYCSRPIEPLFQPDGDLNLGKLSQGVGQFFRKFNSIYWVLSHKTLGDNQVVLKMDLRLTLPQVQGTLDSKIMDGVFILDTLPFADFAVSTMLPPASTIEIMLFGDNAGFLYNGYSSAASNTEIDFSYITKDQDMGTPGRAKRFHKVVAWVNDLGDWNLTLNYWANYKSAMGELSTRAARISSGDQSANAIWDIAFWDVAFWDDYSLKRRAIVFNLSGDQNNAEGDSLKLQFVQNGTNQPITLLGYSVLFSDLGLRK